VKNLTVGRGRTVRIGPWRGDDEVATISTFIDQRLDHDAVSKVVSALSERGYQRTITAALAAEEHQAFVENGFEPLRHLTLLRRTLDTPIPKAQVRARRWRRQQFNQVLDIDHDAFEPFWRFDETALREALDATPHRVLRVDSTVNPTGYALSGVARGSAYLQRLAVRPDAAGSGLGTALLLDALRWMRWRGANFAFANTQHDNHRALDLYRRHGFEAEPEGLTIFQRDL
jgi:ribosomal protein S18 acetylase RimI-like enzyme